MSWQRGSYPSFLAEECSTTWASTMARTHVGKGWWQYCVIVVVVGVCMYVWDVVIVVVVVVNVLCVCYTQRVDVVLLLYSTICCYTIMYYCYATVTGILTPPCFRYQRECGYVRLPLPSTAADQQAPVRALPRLSHA